MTIIELPRRRDAPRVFIEAPAGLPRRVNRALVALGDLDLNLPGLDALGAALVAIADELEGDADLEPGADDEPESEEEALPLFAFAERRRPP